MAYSRLTLANLAALTLATAAILSGGEEYSRWRAVAQSPANSPQTFPIPSSLPTDAILAVDGSSSMELPNETLKQRYLKQFPGARVELNVSQTDAAIAALLAGQLDLVAAGRPLTQAERDRGLAEIPLNREKIAIIVGPNNRFSGDLTFEQFAAMFRGEITDWAAVGGTAGPVRFVDRPAYSDTRQSLSQYQVFADRPFTPGTTADPVAEDSTDAVVAALGDDGIGYAVASQVLGRNDLRILPMHQTLPDDPRYPYSQPRYYIYNRQNPSPEALAWLGFVTSVPGQEVIQPVTPSSPTPTTVSPNPEAETALVPSTPREAGRGGRFPWWLLLIPLLGGLLWWLLRHKGGVPAVAPLVPAAVPPESGRIILTPRNCRRAYAYWEVADEYRAQERDRGGRSLMLRLFDVTDRDLERHPPLRIEQFAVTENQQDLHVPIPVDDRDYMVELGYVTGEDHWLPLAKSAPVRVPPCPKGEGLGDGLGELALPGTALAGGAALAGAALGSGLLDREKTPMAEAEPSRIILTPRTSHQVYAYWEATPEARAALRAQGGVRHQLRIYDVTDSDLDQSPAPSVSTYDVEETDQDRFIPIVQAERDYMAEIGYETEGGKWLPLARSESVRVPANLPEFIPLGGGAGVAAATLLGAREMASVEAPKPESSPALGGVPEIIPTTDGLAASTRPGNCSLQTLTVHSRHNAVQLSPGQIEHLQNQVAVTHTLEAGAYLIRLKAGAFGYGDPTQPGEPLVLLWIYGGQVTNLKTNVKVDATWSTLNGYADTLSLKVHEPAQLRAFFIDTYPENNLGEVTLTLVQL